MSDPLMALLLAAAVSTANVCEELTPAQIGTWARGFERMGFEVPTRWIDAVAPEGGLGELIADFNQRNSAGYEMVAYRIVDELQRAALMEELLGLHMRDGAKLSRPSANQFEFELRHLHGIELPDAATPVVASKRPFDIHIGGRADPQVLCVRYGPGAAGFETSREG